MDDETFDLRLRVLDHQVVDPDGGMVCKVDDVEFARGADGSWHVAALLSGPLALGPRLPGRLGRWVVSFGARLSLQVEPRPRRIPWRRVRELGSAVVVDGRRDELGVAALEDWVRVHVVDRLPGSRHASE
jgi:sporulation protein YlmC with PRC-barrel domain